MPKTGVAWLSLDAADSDPVRFWRHVLAALDRAHPGTAAPVLPLLESPPPALGAVVEALIEQLTQEPPDAGLMLVLDDYHLVDSTAVHAALMFLLEHAPPGLHVVVSSRAEPPMAFARLRARGQLAEIRAAKPDAVFFFYNAGAASINFVKQYAEAGLKETIPLYATNFSLDEQTLPAMGDAALGVELSTFWSADLDNAANKAFVQHFIAQYQRRPTVFAADGYDSARLLDAALKSKGH